MPPFYSWVFVFALSIFTVRAHAQCPSPDLVVVDNIVYDCVGSTYNLTFTLNGAQFSFDYGGTTYGFNGYQVFASPYTVQSCFDAASYQPGYQCFFLYDPVCACNGITYTNADCAEKNGYPENYPGECTGSELVTFTIQGIPSGVGPTVMIRYNYKPALICTKMYTFPPYTCPGGCQPVSVSATSNSPVCSGADLQLQASATNITNWAWSGPGGYAATQQNPARANAIPAYSGIYTVTATNNLGCTGTATAQATVTPPVSIGNITSSSLTGSFTLSGGLPQINGSNYSSVTMTLQGNPGVTATLTGGPWTHGETEIGRAHV